MRQTQKEQLQNAKRAYIMALNDPKDAMSTQRFSVYLDNGNGLDILWPSDSHEGKKSKELLGHQIYTTNRKYPAYHWALSGCGYSKTNEIKRELQTVNKALEVFTISGWIPSNA
jgi:hypothetical protein